MRPLMIRPIRPPAMGQVSCHSAPQADADGCDTDWVCVGVVARPKGVRGAVRITAYTARPEDIAAYGPVYDNPNGRAFALALSGTIKGGVVATIPGVSDRDAAEAFKGTRLYVPRAALPEPVEHEYYHADLIGLRVELDDGSAFGTVRAVHDFGAGDLLEVTHGDDSTLLPFTREAVPVVDIAGGRLVVSRPEVALAGEERS